MAGDAAGLGYRSRVRVAVDGRGAVGFRRHRSHRLEYVQECPIASPAVTATGALAALWPGTTELEVATGGRSGRGGRLGHAAGPFRPAPARPRHRHRGRREGPPSSGRRARGRRAGAPTGFRPGCSGRSTPAPRRRCSTRCWASSARATGRSVVDLYAGAGLFSVPLARRGGTDGLRPRRRAGPARLRRCPAQRRHLPHPARPRGRGHAGARASPAWAGPTSSCSIPPARGREPASCGPSPRARPPCAP